MNQLTERQHIILNFIVDAHISSAQPVGSRHLTERYEMGFSPATVRNEMGHLEEMGFLTHPYTSSGRVPTDVGYRYYVENCVEQEQPFEGAFIDGLERDFRHKARESTFESFADYASRVLSELSKEVGVIIIHDNTPAETPEGAARKMLVRGASHLLDKPEFQDRGKIRGLFETLEEKRELMNCISTEIAGEQMSVSVRIGQENTLQSLRECAVIVSRYTNHGEKQDGFLALVGPRRMQYRESLALVDIIARLIEPILSLK